MTKTQKLMFTIAALTLGLLILGTREPSAQPMTDYQVCAYYADNAGQIVKLRNSGVPLRVVIEAIATMHPDVQNTLRNIALTVYASKWLDPDAYGEYVMDDCMNVLAGEV